LLLKTLLPDALQAVAKQTTVMFAEAAHTYAWQVNDMGQLAAQQTYGDSGQHTMPLHYHTGRAGDGSAQQAYWGTSRKGHAVH
jgi:hypothetical protein